MRILRNRRIGVSFLPVISISFALLFGYTCRASETRTGGEESTITILLKGANEWTLSPQYHMPPRALVFLPLFTWDENREPVPVLVEKWEVSPDHKTFTYFLRRDIFWHDGAAFTAHDIKFTLDLYTHPDVLRMSPDIFTATVLDDHTIAITFHKKSVWLRPLDDYMCYFPRHLLEDLDPAECIRWEFWTRPVGNGPYRYVRHVPKTMMEFKANPEFFRGEPRIKKVVLKFGGDAFGEAKSGQVDVIDLTRQDYLKFGKNSDFVLHLRRTGDFWDKPVGIYWNHRSPLFSDPKVRKALTLSLDRREILRFTNLPDEIPVVDGPLPRQPRFYDQFPDPLPFDPEQAGDLLSEAGWDIDEATGILTKNGREFRFMAYTEARNHQVSVLVQAHLLKVGIRMEIQTADNRVWGAKVRNGDFEALIHEASGYEKRHFETVGYSNPEFFRFIEASNDDWSPGWELRRGLRVWEFFQKDVPLTYLIPGVQSKVAHKRIKGLKAPGRIWVDWHMADLWIGE